MRKYISTLDKRLLRAIIFCTAASLCYSLMALLVKLIAPYTTTPIVVFFRFLISSLWVMLVLFYKRLRGKHFSLITINFNTHILRALASFIAISALYYSLKYVPLANATSLHMTHTLFIPILGFVFLKTQTTFKHCMALVVGFIGVIFILKPHAPGFNPYIILPLVAGLATACSLLCLHILAKTEEPYTIMIYFFPLTCILSCIFAWFNWQTPTLSTLLIILMAGILGTLYYEFVTRAAFYSHPKTFAPALYFNIIFSGLLDWIFWHHIPDYYFWIGFILIFLGCVFSIKYTAPSNSEATSK